MKTIGLLITAVSGHTAVPSGQYICNFGIQSCFNICICDANVMIGTSPASKISGNRKSCQYQFASENVSAALPPSCKLENYKSVWKRFLKTVNWIWIEIHVKRYFLSKIRICTLMNAVPTYVGFFYLEFCIDLSFGWKRKLKS